MVEAKSVEANVRKLTTTNILLDDNEISNIVIVHNRY